MSVNPAKRTTWLGLHPPPQQPDQPCHSSSPVIIETIKSQMNTYTSFVFEDVARHFLYEIIDELPFRFERIGRWWHKDNEIDFVALNEQSRKIMFVECKWKNRKIGVGVLESLMKKAGHVDWKQGNRNEFFCNISKKGVNSKGRAVCKRPWFFLF